jgi:hypothetical protein
MPSKDLAQICRLGRPFWTGILLYLCQREFLLHVDLGMRTEGVS